MSHRERTIEVWTLGEGAESGWSSIVAREGDAAELTSIGARLDVRALYDAAGV